MSLAFMRALSITLGNEGGISDNPADNGGLTKWGITQATYDGFRHAKQDDQQSVRDMTREEMQAIYESDYWIPSHADQLPLSLACCHFDAFVNHRPSVAMQFLQRAVGAPADGKWGPQTMAKVYEAVHIQGELTVVRSYLEAREAFFVAIVDSDPTQRVFLRGWRNRVQHLAQLLAPDAPQALA